MMAITGLKRPTYNQWLNRGTLTANVEANGAGTISTFVFDNILAVELVISMKKIGMNLKRSTRVAHKIIEIAEYPLTFSTVFVTFELKEIKVSFKDPGGTVLILNVEKIIQTVCGKINTL